LERLRPGVFILSIRRGSDANRFRFRPGDRLERINGVDIRQVEDLKKALDGTNNRFDIRVDRDGKSLNLSIGG
ncbi:MAG: PDZ domain-containing protein, partial [Rhodospirillales bacterium]